MSRETLLLCWELLCRSTLEVGADDFDEVALRVLRAKDELRRALDETAPESP